MGKDRAADKDLLVIEDETVDFDGDGTGEETASDRFDFRSSDGADFDQSVRKVPAMIMDAGAVAKAVLDGTAEKPSELLLAHPGMRA